MDRKTIVEVSNAYFSVSNSLDINKIRDILTEYCVEKGKSTQESVAIAEVLTRPQVFMNIGYQAFNFALEYYWKKFNVILLSHKVSLDAYTNLEYKNTSYFLAY